MRKLIMLFVALFAFVIQPLSLWAAEPVPAQLAETMRTALVQAQLAFTSDPQNAQQALAVVQSTYAGDFAANVRHTDPAADARIGAGLNAAQQALQQGDATAFAAARAQVWTALLAGSYALSAASCATRKW